MIFRRRPDVSKDIIALEALKARVPLKSDITKIEDEIRNIKSGLNGEKDSAFHLNSAFPRKDEFVVLHDLRLEDGDDIAQIDHLVITSRRVIFVIETKSLSGRILSADHSAWKISYNNRSILRDSPGKQVERHARHVRSLLQKNGSGMAEVIPVVAISQRERQDLSKFHIGPDMVHTSDLPEYLRRKADAAAETKINHSQPANLEEMIGCAWMIEQKHVDKACNWESRLRLQANPPEQITMPVEGSGENPRLPTRRNKIKPGDPPVIDEVPGGKIRITALSEGILLQWWGSPRLSERFSSECRERDSAIWDVPSSGWILSTEDAKFILKNIRQGKLVTDDLFGKHNTHVIEEKKAEEEREKIENEAIARSRRDALSIDTPYGRITAIPVNIGLGPAFALRHPDNDLLAAFIKRSLASQEKWTVAPQWRQHYSNWIVSESDWHRVTELLGIKDAKKTA